MNLLTALQEYQAEPTGYEPTYPLLMQHLLKTEPRCFWRDCFLPGHFTASTWVVNSTRSKILLIMHPKLHTWLQPGGHADGEENLFNVALREAEEELGLTASRIKASPQIFDLDIQPIPARKDEPMHLHYDVRFLLETDDTLPITSPENLEFRWFTVAEAEAAFPNGHGRWRMLQKTKALAK
ncbi:MAG: NUDIX domain-containing protein [Proteobacteria bacterium]|nr:NUDIX domain-containing protein [Pseudomonadota bacterium]